MLPLPGRRLSQTFSQQCIVDDVTLNYDTFGERHKPAVLLIMGLASQKVRYPSDFCRSLADSGFFVVRFDNRDVGRSSRVSVPGAGRLLSLSGLPGMVLFKLLKQRCWLLLTTYFVLGLATWRRGGVKRRVIHALVGLFAFLHVKFYAPRAPYTVEDMAQDSVRLLDSLGILQANIVGYSMGGMIAQTFARRHPKRCSSLILMSTCSPNAKLIVQPGLLFFLRVIVAAEFAFLPWADDETRGEGIWGLWNCISGPNQAENQKDLAHVEQTRGIQDVDALLRQVMVIMQFTDGRPPMDTSTFSEKTLVIHGQLDPLLPLSHGMELARHMKCKCVVLHDIGHDILPGGQKEVLAAIQVHLCGHSSNADKQSSLKPSSSPDGTLSRGGSSMPQIHRAFELDMR